MASSIFPSSLKQDTPYFVCYPRSTFWQPHTYNALCLLHTWGYHKKGRRVPKGASSKTRRLNGERKKWVPNNANEMWTRCQAPSEKRLFLLYTHGRHQIHFPQSPWDGWLTTTLLSCFNPLFCAWCSCVWNSVSSNTFSFWHSLGVIFHLSTNIYSIFQGIFFNYFCFSYFFL